MSIKDRLIQFVLRGKDELSPEAKKSAEALAAVSAEAEELSKALDSAKDARGLARGLETTQRAAERAERGLVQADLQVKELRDALSKAPGSAGLEQSLKEAEREARRMERGLDKLRETLGEQEKAARAAGIDTNNLADEEKRLAAEVDKAKVALDANSQQLKVLQREHAAAGRAAAEQATKVDGAREAMSRGAKQVLAFAAAYISLNAAFGLVQKGLNLVRDGIYSMLQTGDQFELLDKRLASLMGSVAAGEQATQWIKQFAKDTPLEVADVSEAFALLKTYGLDPMDGSLQAIVDKNEQLGGGMERLSGIASALGQAFAKQKLQTEEILQLVERGVPVWGMLEKITGKNAAQLSKLATEGRLGRDVIKALVDEIGKSADGAAAEGMNTLTGKVSNLKDVWSDFQDRIADSGALDFAKRKLGEVAAKIDEMDKDGRLDKLAKSLSDTFVNGAESIEKYIEKLGGVDFNELADKASQMAKNVGPAIDQALTAGQYTTATLTTVWNTFSILVTSSAAVLAKGVQLTLGSVLLAGGQIAGFFGGSEIKAKADGLYTFLGDLSTGYVEQAKTDLDQIGKAWDFLDEKKGSSTKKQTDAEAEKTAAVKTELEQQRMLNQAHADNLVANQQRVVDAAATGQAAITDMANAINLIDTAKSVQQLEGLRGAILKAYQDGQLSQEQFTQATGLLNSKLSETGGAASGAADGVSDLSDKLGDLASVQSAISNAKTDVDINNIRSALRKLYESGAITAAQYNDELKKTSDRQKELKTAVEQGKKAQDSKNDSDKEAITTSEQLRRESGKRMEAERKAGDAAMQARRKGSEETKRDVSAFEDYFGGVVSRARQPLAAMSAAALEFYDRLRGISSVDVSIDTGSLDATRESLERVTRALSDVQAEAAKPMISALGRWQLETQQASLKTQQAFLGQKAALQDLTETYSRGDISAKQFVSSASSMRRALSLLDDSDLSGLESAISAAQQRMEQMNQSTRGTLEGLMDELDGLQGRTEEIERRKFAARQRELQTQLAEAQAGGDSQAVANAQRALGMLRQIEAETAQQRQRTEQEKRIEVNKPAATPAPAAAATPSKIIRLEVKGKSVDVAVNSEADETNLLDILADAALRAR
ncbi:tape measure protein [Pseudomonas guineae]|uniref:tape measure protein n=1 Tax=Pseudomonas guineae TaxID=425504 RepID=UPI003D0655C5